MDKSVAQKFTIVMSMFVAVFATLIVCGNIINGGNNVSESYMRPLTKSGSTVSYSDNVIDNQAVKYSDIYNDENITVVTFVDDDENDTVITSNQNLDADKEYLYMTTVTTTGSVDTQSASAVRNTTRKIKTSRSTVSTTKKSTVKHTVTTSKKVTTTSNTTFAKPTSDNSSTINNSTTASSQLPSSSSSSTSASETSPTSADYSESVPQ